MREQNIIYKCVETSPQQKRFNNVEGKFERKSAKKKKKKKKKCLFKNENRSWIESAEKHTWNQESQWELKSYFH